MEKLTGPFDAKEPLFGKLRIKFEDNKKLYQDFPDNKTIKAVYLPLMKKELEKQFTKVNWIVTAVDIKDIQTDKVDNKYFNLKGFTLEVKIKPGVMAMTLSGNSGEGGGGGGMGGFSLKPGENPKTGGALLLATIITLAISATIITMSFTIDGEEWSKLGEAISSSISRVTVLVLAIFLLKYVNK